MCVNTRKEDSEGGLDIRVTCVGIVIYIKVKVISLEIHSYIFFSYTGGRILLFISFMSVKMCAMYFEEYITFQG